MIGELDPIRIIKDYFISHLFKQHNTAVIAGKYLPTKEGETYSSQLHITVISEVAVFIFFAAFSLSLENNHFHCQELLLCSKIPSVTYIYARYLIIKLHYY